MQWVSCIRLQTSLPGGGGPFDVRGGGWATRGWGGGGGGGGAGDAGRGFPASPARIDTRVDDSGVRWSYHRPLTTPAPSLNKVLCTHQRSKKTRNKGLVWEKFA